MFARKNPLFDAAGGTGWASDAGHLEIGFEGQESAKGVCCFVV